MVSTPEIPSRGRVAPATPRPVRYSLVRALVLAGAALLILPPAEAADTDGSLVKTPYGKTTAGDSIDQYTLTNARGLEVKVITYGGLVTSIRNPKRHMPNIVLGFASLHDYETQNSPGPHFGALIGRYANRIANGVFTLDGVAYCLDINNPPNTLHGGLKGFDTHVWTVTKEIHDKDAVGIELHWVSPAGDGWSGNTANSNCPASGMKGFPGNLDTYVTYLVTSQNRLVIRYRATTDAPTVVNLTNHNYWNLTGEGSGTVYAQQVRILADRMTPVGSTQIPDGSIVPVAGTPFDFRKAKPIGQDIRSDNAQMQAGHGYDNNWVLTPTEPGHLRLAASAVDPVSHRSLEVWTDQPGLQFYAGNSLDGSNIGPSHRAYRESDGFAFETQHFPDSPNQPKFPSTVLRPGQTYETTTAYRISE